MCRGFLPLSSTSPLLPSFPPIAAEVNLSPRGKGDREGETLYVRVTSFDGSSFVILLVCLKEEELIKTELAS